MTPCVLIPIYNHRDTIRGVVTSLAPSGLSCIIVDDGSNYATRSELDALEHELDWVEVVHHARRSGKGAALKTGFRYAGERGFTHAVHLDADGQHDTLDVTRFVEVMRENPHSLVLGRPLFDASVPKRRLYARQISRAFVWLSTLSFDVADPLCGYRGVPIADVLAVIDRRKTGDWMDFEPEIVVRLFWEGLTVVNLPTHVIYHPGGLSHFSFARDYPRLGSLYARLLLGMLVRLPRVAVTIGQRAKPKIGMGKKDA